MSMTDSLTYSVQIATDPMGVYRALTEEFHVKKWWTTTCQMNRAIGGMCRFEFGKTYHEMMIESLTPGKTVVWRCTGQYHFIPGRVSSPSDWVGTRVKFTLSEAGDKQTQLDFEHKGVTRMHDCYGLTEELWEAALGDSLKHYLEEGASHGKPWRPEA